MYSPSESQKAPKIDPKVGSAIELKTLSAAKMILHCLLNCAVPGSWGESHRNVAFQMRTAGNKWRLLAKPH